jgi:hypothetical protein
MTSWAASGSGAGAWIYGIIGRGSAMYFWSPARRLPTCFETPWLQLLISQQFLRGLLYLFEQPSVVARLIDRRLQFLAQLGKPLQSLLVGEILIQRVFEGHRPSAHEYVLALS